MQHNGWDHALKVTADGTGLVGHAGAVLLRKAADQAGLTAWVSTALRRAGTSPVLDRGIVLVSMAAAIALGATSMSDIAVLAHLAPVLGAAPSGPAGPGPGRDAGRAGPDRPRPRESPRARMGPDPGDSYRVPVAGHRREDPDGVAGHRPGRHRGHRQLGKEGAAPTWKKGYGPPIGAWCANTREPLAMLLRPGNSGSNTFTDHRDVLAAAIRQVPARFRRKILIRVDGAGASHDLIKHLLSLSSPRRTVLFSCGWMITAADEDAIRQVPVSAWKPGTAQDGTAEDDKDVAEITALMTRAGTGPAACGGSPGGSSRPRRHLPNLTDYEQKTGWKYSITCTNTPGTGIAGVPGSHHPQYIDTVHREHAAVETAGVRTAKAMGLRNLP